MQNAQLAYQKQAILNSSPLKLVVKMYDLVIQATYREEDQRVREILSGLIQGLNFDYEPAGQLFEIYRYCQDLSRKKRFEEIREILEPLRDTWEQVSSKSVEQNQPVQ